MQYNPVGWFEIYVQDMQRARTFYETVFQVQLARLEGTGPEMWAFPMQEEGYGSAGALVYIPGVPSGANSVIVYFRCADCAMEAERAAAGGGKVHKDKLSIGPYGFIALVADTEGNTIGLHSLT
jgi:predicted enzyme related to lactoylglutathione lyase